MDQTTTLASETLLSRVASLRLKLRAAVLIGGRDTALRECLRELRSLEREGSRTASPWADCDPRSAG